MSILFFLSHTICDPCLKYQIRYYLISECSNSLKGTSKIPSYLSKQPTLNSAWSRCSFQVILSMMFLAVLNFYFFQVTGCSLIRLGVLYLSAEAIRISQLSIMVKSHTFLFVIYFHSILLVFSSMLLISNLLSSLLRRKVEFP